MSHQDWTPVVFSNNSKKTTHGGVVETVRKPTGNQPSAASINARKIESIDSSDDKLSHKMIDTTVVDVVKRRRCELKLTQKDLANKSQVLEATIKNLEQGKELHNPPLLTKLQRALGVKLLGQNIGELI
jgi:putative transcription factor